MKYHINSIVPIVFASNENYIMPTAVAIKSIVDNYSGESLYFVILVQGTLSEDSIRTIDEAIKSKKINIEVKYIAVDEALFGNLKTHIKHITMATYYRLLLPELLTEYDKCLYLDGDICVTGDVKELFDIELSSAEYVAGVRAYSIITSKIVGKKRLNILKIDDLNNYINAGVLIMNLVALRSSGTANSWMNLAKNDYPVQDQDVINVACYGHIKVLPPRYNSMPVIYRYSHYKLSKVYCKQEVDDARKKTCIIHYADSYKPWKYLDVNKAEIWRYFYKKLFGTQIENLQTIGLSRFINTQKGRINYILKRVRK